MHKMALSFFILALTALCFFPALAHAQMIQRPSMEPRIPVLNVDHLLEAIRVVEDAHHYQYGAAGEQGDYQILPSVWRAYSKKPFGWTERYKDAVAVAEVRRVAELHAEWILSKLAHLQQPFTAHSFGLMWTAGYGAVRTRTYSKAKLDYARRVQNVYDSLSK